MSLRLDWCSREAATLACKRWHYSGSIPPGKLVTVGVWEQGSFRGAIVFCRGSTPRIGDPYGLRQDEVCELGRVALRDHEAPVTRMLSIALKMFARINPGIRLVVSYADLDQGHKGAIYQAGNWIYRGRVASYSILLHGKKVHARSVVSKFGTSAIDWLRRNVDPRAERLDSLGRHKYLWAFDRSLRKKLRADAQPYPRAESKVALRSPHQEGKGGSIPTSALERAHG